MKPRLQRMEILPLRLPWLAWAEDAACLTRVGKVASSRRETLPRCECFNPSQEVCLYGLVFIPFLVKHIQRLLTYVGKEK